MSSNIEVITLAEELIYVLCKGNATVKGLIPRGDGIRLWPTLGPPEAEIPFATQDFGGDAFSPATPIGQAPYMWRFSWVITVWTDGIRRQNIGPLALALQAALIGPNMLGQEGSFTSDGGTTVNFTIRYQGPVPAPAQVGAEGKWHRISTAYTIDFRRTA